MLMVNFPLVSRALSFFPLSTPIRLIFPAWLPVAMNLESGENATVQVSTVKISNVLQLVYQCKTLSLSHFKINHPFLQFMD